MAITRSQKAALLAIPVSLLIGVAGLANTGRPLDKTVSGTVMVSVLQGETNTSFSTQSKTAQQIIKLVKAGYELEAMPLFNEYINIGQIGGEAERIFTSGYSDLLDRVEAELSSKRKTNVQNINKLRAEVFANKNLININKATLTRLAADQSRSVEAKEAAQAALTSINNKIAALNNKEAKRVEAKSQDIANVQKSTANNLEDMNAELEVLRAELEVQDSIFADATAAVNKVMANLKGIWDGVLSEKLKNNSTVQESINKDAERMAESSETFNTLQDIAEKAQEEGDDLFDDISDLEDDIRDAQNASAEDIASLQNKIKAIQARVAAKRAKMQQTLAQQNRALDVLTSATVQVPDSASAAQITLITAENDSLAASIEVASSSISKLLAKNAALR